MNQKCNNNLQAETEMNSTKTIEITFHDNTWSLNNIATYFPIYYLFIQIFKHVFHGLCIWKWSVPLLFDIVAPWLHTDSLVFRLKRGQNPSVIHPEPNETDWSLEASPVTAQGTMRDSNGRTTCSSLVSSNCMKYGDVRVVSAVMVTQHHHNKHQRPVNTITPSVVSDVAK